MILAESPSRESRLRDSANRAQPCEQPHLSLQLRQSRWKWSVSITCVRATVLDYVQVIRVKIFEPTTRTSLVINSDIVCSESTVSRSQSCVQSLSLCC